MFHFEHITHLWALLLLPLLIAFFYGILRGRQRDLAKLGEWHLVQKNIQNFTTDNRLRGYFACTLATLLLLILAWANPLFGTKNERATQAASNVVIALDVSKSMLCQDILPSRLDRAQNFVSDMIKSLRKERIGTVIFAGNAYLQMPLTDDFEAAEMFIKTANPYQIPTQGTAIGEAIKIAERTFPKESAGQNMLIIVSDGEDHSEKSESAAKAAAERGIAICTVGIGTTEGGQILERSEQGVQAKIDETGQLVITKLNEQGLQKIAAAAGGTYFNLAKTPNILEALKAQVATLQKKQATVQSRTQGESYYQILIGLALCLIVFEFWWRLKK